MVLLKWRLNGDKNGRYKHLHSTMVLLKFGIANNSHIGSNISTFHYGSIKIGKLDPSILPAEQNGSTFHYGSIKIKVF